MRAYSLLEPHLEVSLMIFLFILFFFETINFSLEHFSCSFRCCNNVILQHSSSYMMKNNDKADLSFFMNNQLAKSLNLNLTPPI
jgi:hypothetical protein